MTVSELQNLIDRSLFAEIGYTDEHGYQNIRKVFCVWHKGLGSHLISTNTSSRHVASLTKDSRACLYFSDENTFEGLCLYGSIRVRHECEYRELLWNEGDEKYYPKGIEDEDYCVLEFIARGGRYYRADGKGELSASELAASEDALYENGYAKTHPEDNMQ